jgi:branched-chain amino acid transport system substrate-binding protein
MRLHAHGRTRSARKGLAAVALVPMMALLAACGGGGSAATGDEANAPYRVGLLLGLTGGAAALGVPEQKAANAYVERVNANGGINGRKLELVTVDSRSDESTAVSSMRKLATQDNVIAVVGPSTSGESVAVRQVADSLRIPTLTLGSAAAITKGSTYTFKCFYSPDISVRAILSAAKDSGAQTVASIAPLNAYGDEGAGAVKSLASEYGLRYLGAERYNADAVDLTPQLTKLKGRAPDVLVSYTVLPQSAIILKNAQSIGLKSLVIQGPGASSQELITKGGSAAEGTLVQGSKSLVNADLIPDDDPQKKVAAAFQEAYQKATGERGGQFAGNAWDGMTLLETALQAGDIDPSDVNAAREALLKSLNTNIKDVPGLNSKYTFDAEHHSSDTLDGVAVLKVEKGDFTIFSRDVTK